MKASSRKEREEVLPIRDGKGSVLLNTGRAKMPSVATAKGFWEERWKRGEKSQGGKEENVTGERGQGLPLSQ